MAQAATLRRRRRRYGPGSDVATQATLWPGRQRRYGATLWPRQRQRRYGPGVTLRRRRRYGPGRQRRFWRCATFSRRKRRCLGQTSPPGPESQNVGTITSHHGPRTSSPVAWPKRRRLVVTPPAEYRCRAARRPTTFMGQNVVASGGDASGGECRRRQAALRSEVSQSAKPHLRTRRQM
jgi:hypothetical protein